MIYIHNTWERISLFIVKQLPENHGTISCSVVTWGPSPLTDGRATSSGPVKLVILGLCPLAVARLKVTVIRGWNCKAVWHHQITFCDGLWYINDNVTQYNYRCLIMFTRFFSHFVVVTYIVVWKPVLFSYMLKVINKTKHTKLYLKQNNVILRSFIRTCHCVNGNIKTSFFRITNMLGVKHWSPTWMANTQTIRTSNFAFFDKQRSNTKQMLPLPKI